MLDPILMCAVCHRPVERWEAIEEPVTFTRHFVAYCHGEREACTLDRRYLADLNHAIRKGQRVEAVAFQKQALEAPDAA
jgi:uncharacterized protein YifE (UPF0438 family)